MDLSHREHADLDPCEHKQCPAGTICKEIRNPTMLQLPIAYCEKVKGKWIHKFVRAMYVC